MTPRIVFVFVGMMTSATIGALISYRLSISPDPVQAVLRVMPFQLLVGAAIGLAADALRSHIGLVILGSIVGWPAGLVTSAYAATRVMYATSNRWDPAIYQEWGWAIFGMQVAVGAFVGAVPALIAWLLRNNREPEEPSLPRSG